MTVFCVLFVGVAAAGGTGFYRVASAGGRDTVIAPNGSSMFMLGCCHVHPRGSYSHALGYSPYGRFCETNYPSKEVWAEETAARLKMWGFNSLGAACDTNLLGKAFPHVGDSSLRMGQDFARGSDSERWIRPFQGAPCQALPNVFHPDWPAHCDAVAAAKCAPCRDDPDRIGYYIDNELAWWGLNGDRGTGVFDAIASFPSGHSARKALERWLSENRSFVETAPPVSAKLAFLRHFARTYFEVTTAAIRRHDPNHLILGCRFAGLQGAHPVVWEECGKFCDIVSFNCYPWADLDHGVVLDEKCGVPMEVRLREYHGYADRPLFISEWSFPALDTGHPCLKGAGQRVPTQVERAEAAALFLRTMRSDPHVVGCDWFMWCDRPAAGGHKANAEDCNYGLVGEDGKPYKGLIEVFENVANVKVLPIANANVANGGASSPGEPKNVDLRFVDNEDLTFVNDSPVSSYTLSNAFVRISGAAGSRYLADEIAFAAGTGGPPASPAGRFGAMLYVIDQGTNAYLDVERLESIALATDPATGAQGAILRATSGSTFAIAVRISLAPDSREPEAEILAVENLGDGPLDVRHVLMRPWSLEEKPEAVPKVLDCWGAPCEAEWRIAGGGSWGVSSRDAAAKRFRFFLDRNGRQHPDARFAAVDSQGRATDSNIPPGATWRPASPMTARIYRKPPEGGPR